MPTDLSFIAKMRLFFQGIWGEDTQVLKKCSLNFVNWIKPVYSGHTIGRVSEMFPHKTRTGWIYESEEPGTEVL